MSLIADGLLIATCLTTAIYCLVLSRRLRRLSDTGEGVGQQILRLNTALAETTAAVAEVRSAARTASDQLQEEIAAAKRQGQHLQRQIARAHKSGTGEPQSRQRPVGAGVRDRPPAGQSVSGEHERTKTQDFAVSLQPVVEFEAVDADEEDLDTALRTADATDAGDLDADLEAEDAEDDGFVGTGDLSEAEDHWPFDGSDGDEENDDDFSEADPEVAVDYTVDAGATGADPGIVRRRAVEPGDTGPGGPLRVDRMAV